MTSWLLFRHAFRMLVQNLWPAAQISVLPIGLCMAFILVFDWLTGANGGTPATLLTDPWETTQTQEPAAIATFFVLLTLGLIITWVAVAWHRYILLGEQSRLFLPRLNLPEMGSYLIALVKIMFLTFVLLIPMLVLSIFAPSATLTLVTIAVTVVGTAIFFKVGFVLPAAAMGKSLTLKQAWATTKGHSIAILGLAAISTAFDTVLGLGVDVFAGSFFQEPVALAATAFNIFLSLSILTTLYGYFVEDRDLT